MFGLGFFWTVKHNICTSVNKVKTVSGLVRGMGSLISLFFLLDSEYQIESFSWVCFRFLNGVLCAWNCPNTKKCHQNLYNDIHIRLIALYSYSPRNSLICVSFNFLLKFLWGMIENSIKCLELKTKDLIDTIILWLFICLCLSTNMAQ